MKQLPTAEELMTKAANEHSYETWGEMMYDTHEHSQIEYTREVMIEFAKLHVQAALESASEKSNLLLTDKKGNTKTTGGYDAYGSIATVNKQSILNSYTLENIK